MTFELQYTMSAGFKKVGVTVVWMCITTTPEIIQTNVNNYNVMYIIKEMIELSKVDTLL